MRPFLFAAALAAAAAGVATHAQAAPEDPLESFNRVGFAIEAVLDRYILRPIALVYRALTPGPIGHGIHNVVTNLGAPVVILNDMLQARPKRLADDTARFALNSTFGIGGLLDVAVAGGLPFHPNGFGNTLGRYGVQSGPYLYVPLIGPSTFRDLTGEVVDGFINPVNFVNYDYRTQVSVGVAVAGGVDLRARSEDQLRALNADAADPYATLRAAYLQDRQGEIDEDKPISTALPDLEDPAATPAPLPSPPTDAPSSPPAPASQPAPVTPSS